LIASALAGEESQASSLQMAAACTDAGLKAIIDAPRSLSVPRPDAIRTVLQNLEKLSFPQWRKILEQRVNPRHSRRSITGRITERHDKQFRARDLIESALHLGRQCQSRNKVQAGWSAKPREEKVCRASALEHDGTLAAH
jgi:hypothetical protein